MCDNEIKVLALRTLAYHYPGLIFVETLISISKCCKAAVLLFRKELSFVFQKCFKNRFVFDEGWGLMMGVVLAHIFSI
jgi:hypothetical protein